MNKLLQRFLNEKIAIAVRTQEEYDQFMQLLESKTDVRWGNGKNPTQQNYWNHLEEMTSVAFNFEDENVLGYSRYGFYEDEGYEIIEFEDLLKGEEKIMTPADKLRFLADRVEDGKEFIYYCTEYCFFEDEEKWLVSGLSFKGMISGDGTFKLKPQWEFTEDEKTILKSMNPTWNYIARDRYNALYAYHSKPVKTANSFIAQDSSHWLQAWEHLFQSVKWSDEEACEFREYL